MVFLEKDKCYMMNLYMIVDMEVPIQGDKFRKYFTSVNGVFVQNDNFYILDSVVVKRVGYTNNVVVLGTDIEIPCVLLEIEDVVNRNEFDVNNNILKYTVNIEGRTDKLFGAFAINKLGNVPVLEHEKNLLLREATEEEISSQIEKANDVSYTDNLSSMAYGFKAKEESVSRNYKETLKLEKKNRMVRALKKVLP